MATQAPCSNLTECLGFIAGLQESLAKAESLSEKNPGEWGEIGVGIGQAVFFVLQMALLLGDNLRRLRCWFITTSDLEQAVTRALAAVNQRAVYEAVLHAMEEGRGAVYDAVLLAMEEGRGTVYNTVLQAMASHSQPMASPPSRRG